MTEQLQSMLREAADDRPEFALRRDPWRRGRRIRLGRRVAGAAVAVTVVVAGTVLLTTPDLTSTPEPAEEDFGEPALPDTLYEVPPNIADIKDDPLGEPAAVVYSGTIRTGLFSDEDRPVVVAAESGAVRAIKEAGPRDQPVLSPDGRLLAVVPPFGFGAENQQPSVLVVNVVTGDSTRHELPDDGLGGRVDTLTWKPNSSTLAITVLSTTSRNGGGGSVGFRDIHGVLDVSTGAWREVEGRAFVLAFSHDGQRLATDNLEPAAAVLQNADGLDAVYAALDGRFGVRFSPDNSMVAGALGPIAEFTQADPYELRIVDAETGDQAAHMELGEYADARVVGWGERGILVHTTTAGDDAHSVVELIDLSDSANPARTTIIDDRSNSGRIGIAAAFVDADMREAGRPDAPFDWHGLIPDPVLLVFVAAVGLIVVIVYRSGRGRSGRGSATVRDSTGR